VLAHQSLTLVLDSVTNERRLWKCSTAADEVYHLAAVVGVQLVMEQPERTAHTNIGPTEAILRQLASRPRPLFLASTSEVYGKNRRCRCARTTTSSSGRRRSRAGSMRAARRSEEYLALQGTGFGGAV